MAPEVAHLRRELRGSKLRDELVLELTRRITNAVVAEGDADLSARKPKSPQGRKGGETPSRFTSARRT
jgi:hypothetical protein